MGKVITYAKNNKQCFCQIKFESGERILISISGPPNAAVKIFKLGFFGTIPIQTVWEYSAKIAGDFDAYIHGLQLMFPEIKHPLDDIRDRLLVCTSISEARNYLLTNQRNVGV
ncbi:hypothetical protein SCT_1317 [Sulfuricella sp. T08]|uniref:hypothetical protein n=1 Tax=Sulfuricella sp. T08 TaxID=1632857 RepID=UPI000617961F|nr:hypothetical protein [Sulfuricella sp. T08]GAO35921.1 hypothetical protein SCT_1317 [Sulfuricella sp. T08]